jgi:hypothetical protein
MPVAPPGALNTCPAATVVRLPAAALSWFPRPGTGNPLRATVCPSGSCFLLFLHQPGKFQSAKPGFWRKASGPEHKLLRDPATQAVSLQAAFQSELICKQMQGLLLRPVDCSESLSLRLFGIGSTVIMQETRYNPSENGQKLAPRLLLLRMTTRFSSWRVLLFVMISGNVTSHCFVLNSPGHAVGHVFPRRLCSAVSSYRIGECPLTPRKPAEHPLRRAVHAEG